MAIAKKKKKKLFGDKYLDDVMIMNKFFMFFIVIFILVFLSMIVIEVESWDSIKVQGEKVNQALKGIYYLPVHFIASIVLLLFGWLFFDTCDDFDKRGFSPLSAVFVSIFSTLAMMFLGFVLARGFLLIEYVYDIPFWSVSVVFFVNVFICVSINFRVTGIFLFDVLSSALSLTGISLLVSIGVFSIHVTGFTQQWSLLLIILCITATIKRFFLWKHEN